MNLTKSALASDHRGKHYLTQRRIPRSTSASAAFRINHSLPDWIVSAEHPASSLNARPPVIKWTIGAGHATMKVGSNHAHPTVGLESYELASLCAAMTAAYPRQQKGELWVGLLTRHSSITAVIDPSQGARAGEGTGTRWLYSGLLPVLLTPPSA